ncbi:MULTISPECIES: sugar transferase [unclassified Actinotalea]|uniref:sugar transferase n=1 Tax=unclassified Actinotalea TaxID=2638618 RepID=UPI0015F4C211|nr:MULTISPECIES: sugar transferase [unclassified Actinotalea]
MTLAAEPGFDRPSEHDRRGVAAEARRSWASAQPFEHRRTPFNDDAALAHLWSARSVVYRWRVVALDTAVAVAVVAAAVVPRYGTALDGAVLLVAGVTGFLGLVAAARGYHREVLGDGPAEYQALLRAGGLAMALLMALGFITGLDIPPALVLGGVPALVVVLIAARYVNRRALHRERARGAAMRRTVVVGDPADVARVVVHLQGAPHHGYQVTGVCVPSLGTVPGIGLVPVVGAVADVPQVVVDRAIDVVVVAGRYLGGEALRRLSWALDRAGAQLIVAPDLVEVTTPRLTVRPTAGLSLLEVEIGAPRQRLVAKALLDRVVGMALALAALPVVLVAAVLVRATSPGPAFYRQSRIGVDGSTFTMWKLRTMFVDADARRAALLASNEGSGVLFKMREDPRVTRVGRLLRRYSLDELPQLLNVVKGDMSLVGPRPPLASEVAGYEDSVHRRLRVKPGLTGLWQVSGRSDLSWEEAVRLDLRYVDNWSLAMDLTILWKTARAVLGGHGAY